MCGIISYIGKTNALQVIINGLKHLESRGYDSAGIAIGDSQHKFKVIKTVGHISELVKKTSNMNLYGHTCIGHTRWATHGSITEENAHPQVSNDGKFILVHNGVIENSENLKKLLKKRKIKFHSETDTEVLVNLIAFFYRNDISNANASEKFYANVARALKMTIGTYGIVILNTDCPNEMIGVRKGSPLILGIHNREGLFLSSTTKAFSETTNKVVYLEENEIIHILNNSTYVIKNSDNDKKTPEVEEIETEQSILDLGQYKHYMLKEIYEQKTSLYNTIAGRFSYDNSSTRFGGLQKYSNKLKNIKHLILVGCGSAMNACKVGKYFLEKYTNLDVKVEYASEFHYKRINFDKNTAVIAVTQSGETLDTLKAVIETKRKGILALSITNVVGSSIAREADGGIYQRSGSEIGVASTKAFTGQVCILIMLTIYFGRLHMLTFQDGVKLTNVIKQLPDKVEETLNSCVKQIKKLAKKYANCSSFFFIGRQFLYPIAEEAALKMKETSYIHAEAYPSGELKHGPLALINEEFPTIVLATNNEILSKNISNMIEIKSHKGKIIAVATEGATIPKKAYDDIIYLPNVSEIISPIITILPMQLLAYYIALKRKCDIDKPRNLAKSVTVE